MNKGINISFIKNKIVFLSRNCVLEQNTTTHTSQQVVISTEMGTNYFHNTINNLFLIYIEVMPNSVSLYMYLYIYMYITKILISVGLVIQVFLCYCTYSIYIYIYTIMHCCTCILKKYLMASMFG